MKKYMAYNHNDTPLMKEPSTKSEAEDEVAEYVHATGNAAYVQEVVEEPTKEEVKEPYPWRSVLMWSVVASMKLGIINDINVGILPPTIKSFADLRKYVNADEYGGFCIDAFAEELIELLGGRDENERPPQAFNDFLNEAQLIIDTWLKSASSKLAPQEPKLILVN